MSEIIRYQIKGQTLIKKRSRVRFLDLVPRMVINKMRSDIYANTIPTHTYVYGCNFSTITPYFIENSYI